MHKEAEVYVDDMIIKSKLLGYVISLQGIKVNPSKIKVIQEMQPPKIEKEIRGFLGHL